MHNGSEFVTYSHAYPTVNDPLFQAVGTEEEQSRGGLSHPFSGEPEKNSTPPQPGDSI